MHFNLNIKHISKIFLVYILFSKVCFAQIKHETKVKYVGGTNSALPGLNIGIVLGRIDTSYYMRCQLYIPAMQYSEIYLSRKSNMSFVLKSGKSVDLSLENIRTSMVFCSCFGFSFKDFRILLKNTNQHRVLL